MAFDAQSGARPLSFGVSGLLYNSDVLLYDRATMSLWSQILQTAVSGPLKGTRLQALPLTHTSWADWRRHYPYCTALACLCATARNATGLAGKRTDELDVLLQTGCATPVAAPR